LQIIAVVVGVWLVASVVSACGRSSHSHHASKRDAARGATHAITAVGVDTAAPGSTGARGVGSTNGTHPHFDAPHYRYDFRCDDALRTLAATVCFEGFTPSHLVPEMANAKPFLRHAHVGGRRLPTDERGVRLDTLKRGDCVSYQVAIDQSVATGSLHDGVTRVGDDLLIAPDYWLWSPQPRPKAAQASARFALPRGVDLALPWPLHPSGARLIPPSAHVWKSQAALGRFETRQLAVPGGQLDVALLGDGFVHADEVIAWLAREAATVARLFGTLPHKRIQVLLIPRGSGASSFGYTVRGGGASVALQLARDADAQSLASDWTAAHELLHTGLPTVHHEEAWLFEGVTTYYTAVVRGRAGGHGEHDGWWGMLDGFRRGRSIGGQHTLRQESRQMHQARSYWRVYWAGAALALMIDVELRKHGHGSLEAALAKLAHAHLDETKSWRSEELARRVDAMTGSQVCSRIIAGHLDRASFPDVVPTLRALGVHLDSAGHIAIDDSAPLAAVRRAIIP
jgi:hypothetical protein